MLRFLKPRASRLTDEQLFARLLAGDRVAFDQLYTQALPMTIKVLTRLGCPAAEAEDLFQDGLLALWQNAQDGKYRPQAGTKVTSYLVQLCRNRWIDRTRRVAYRKTQSVGEHDHSIAAPEDAIADEEALALKQLDAGFAAISERCQELLKAFYFRKTALAALAESLGVGIATAKNEKYRCMQRLRKACVAAKAQNHD